MTWWASTGGRWQHHDVLAVLHSNVNYLLGVLAVLPVESSQLSPPFAFKKAFKGTVSAPDSTRISVRHFKLLQPVSDFRRRAFFIIEISEKKLDVGAGVSPGRRLCCNQRS
jgi:hypothetical protein